MLMCESSLHHLSVLLLALCTSKSFFPGWPLHSPACRWGQQLLKAVTLMNGRVSSDVAWLQTGALDSKPYFEIVPLWDTGSARPLHICTLSQL